MDTKRLFGNIRHPRVGRAGTPRHSSPDLLEIASRAIDFDSLSAETKQADGHHEPFVLMAWLLRCGKEIIIHSIE